MSQAAWRGVDARERAGHNRACESACRLEPRSLLQRRQPGACAPICESQNRATLGTHSFLTLAGSVIGSFASEAMLLSMQETTIPSHPSHGHAVAASSPHTTHSTHTQEEGRKQVEMPTQICSIGH